jgi:hypothetical protein
LAPQIGYRLCKPHLQGCESASRKKDWRILLYFDLKEELILSRVIFDFSIPGYMDIFSRSRYKQTPNDAGIESMLDNRTDREPVICPLTYIETGLWFKWLKT